MADRSYGQYCGLSRALDVVGSRWSLLIVRELLLGPRRFGELHSALPGIATNLLTDRLRQLEADGVVERDLDHDSNRAVYHLTPWGEGLRETVSSLLRWSTPLMVSGPQADNFRYQWLLLPLEAFLSQRTADRPVQVAVEVDGGLISIDTGPGGTAIRVDEGPPAGTVLTGTVLRCAPEVVLGLACGMLPVPQAVAMGELDGHIEDLDAVFGTPAGQPAVTPQG